VKAAEVRAKFREVFEEAITNARVASLAKIDQKQAALDDAFYKL